MLSWPRAPRCVDCIPDHGGRPGAVSLDHRAQHGQTFRWVRRGYLSAGNKRVVNTDVRVYRWITIFPEWLGSLERAVHLSLPCRECFPLAWSLCPSIFIRLDVDARNLQFFVLQFINIII